MGKAIGPNQSVLALLAEALIRNRFFLPKLLWLEDRVLWLEASMVERMCPIVFTIDLLQRGWCCVVHKNVQNTFGYSSVEARGSLDSLLFNHLGNDGLARGNRRHLLQSSRWPRSLFTNGVHSGRTNIDFHLEISTSSSIIDENHSFKASEC